MVASGVSTGDGSHAGRCLHFLLAALGLSCPRGPAGEGGDSSISRWGGDSGKWMKAVARLVLGSRKTRAQGEGTWEPPFVTI